MPDRIEEKRFWSRVNKTDGCWLWTGSKHRQGYGRIGFRGNRSAFAHRVAWTLTKGTIPDGMTICHSCDTQACVRPDHLFCGSQMDNMRDAARKGRMGKVRGNANNKSRVSEADARRVKFGTEKLAPLARELGVSYAALYEIRKGNTWRHLT